MGAPDQISETALEWLDEGRHVAVATVVETWGSAPRPVGSQLVISDLGDMEGSVSGGCVEGAVIVEAQDAMTDGQGRVLTFGVSDDQAFAVGLACGGTIKVMLQPVGPVLDADILRAVSEAHNARCAIGIQTDMDSFKSALVTREAAASDPEFDAMFYSDKSGMVGADRFLAVHNPALRLAVVGAVHIAQPLVEMARLAGYQTTLIDPREAFATTSRFPGVEISHDWPDAALDAFGLDARTAVVTLTHDPKLDDPAIVTALKNDVFYLGSLGSKRTHAKRLDRLHAAGFSDEDLARIHGPVGLDIGAKSPAEIAVSIMAELTQCLRQRS